MRNKDRTGQLVEFKPTFWGIGDTWGLSTGRKYVVAGFDGSHNYITHNDGITKVYFEDHYAHSFWRGAKKISDINRTEKARRAKLMKSLSAAGRRVVDRLMANPDAFGCQRQAVVELAAAITGDDADKIRKALA